MKERFYVYVIELADRVPHAVGRCDVYVGSSAIPPKERFKKHLFGEHGSRHVRRRGVRLRPDLYRGYNPLTSRASAMRAEHHLANMLASYGHRVYGACSYALTPECVL